MREIKFRAWIAPENIFEWDKKMYPSGGMFTGFSFDDIYRGRDEANVTCADGKNISEPKWDKMVLMQYTGLKDKNGREIYEDDLVRCGDGTVGTVMWQVNWTGFVLVSPEWETPRSINHTHNNRGVEVIGNIHEGERV